MSVFLVSDGRAEDVESFDPLECRFEEGPKESRVVVYLVRAADTEEAVARVADMEAQVRAEEADGRRLGVMVVAIGLTLLALAVPIQSMWEHGFTGTSFEPHVNLFGEAKPGFTVGWWRPAGLRSTVAENVFWWACWAGFIAVPWIVWRKFHQVSLWWTTAAERVGLKLKRRGARPATHG